MKRAEKINYIYLFFLLLRTRPDLAQPPLSPVAYEIRRCHPREVKTTLTSLLTCRIPSPLATMPFWQLDALTQMLPCPLHRAPSFLLSETLVAFASGWVVANGFFCDNGWLVANGFDGCTPIKPFSLKIFSPTLLVAYLPLMKGLLLKSRLAPGTSEND